ncbi:MAG: hypothetical protein FH751_07265, partial [Firmicutes bacterium]|nr:hypothetical protein [Bacillota bacterium]
MSDINKYGKKIKEIEFSLIDNDEYKDFKNFIIYERGLLIEKSFFLWHDVIYVTYHNKDKKIIINLNDQRELKIYSKEKSELMSFYNKASKQVEKYRHFDTLKKLKVDLDEINIVMDTNSFDDEAYLDTLTGDIIYIPMELNEDNVYDEDYIKDLPKWEQEEAEHIKKVYE